MKVDNPRFSQNTGEVSSCKECPLEVGADDGGLCMQFSKYDCPTAETYESACRLAEQANKGEKDA